MRPIGLDVIIGCLVACAFGWGAVAPRFAHADIDPNSGIDFVRIGAVNNPAWPGTTPPTPGDRAVGRGSVGYEYHIGKFEVTTAQWVEFFNAAYDRPASDRIPHLVPPSIWGAVGTTATTPGGQRWRVPAGNEMLPVGTISWRMAAIYCNWLCNNKSTAREAFLNGAYDVSTFGFGDPFGFSDQLTHNPGARYWIPTWDEWIKAAHYDPNKANADGSRGGWWQYSTTSDTAPIYGPPGQRVVVLGLPGPDPNGPLAQANSGWNDRQFPGFVPESTPLGAYAGVTSPWGMFDTAGGMSEWTEETLGSGSLLESRFFDGSGIYESASNSRASDAIRSSGADFPSLALPSNGFRIASSVPSPSTFALGVGAIVLLNRRRRHGGSHAKCSTDWKTGCSGGHGVPGRSGVGRADRR